MKLFLTTTLLGLFSIGLLGCEASGRIGDDDHGDRTVKKTTYIEPDGDRTTKTEVHIEH